jgi:glycolate oxidase FAD binding subunit
MTVRAGTTLGEIAAATGAHGQWLPLDPCGDDAGTIGATVATASSGPHATGFGTPRDHLLGIEFVTGAGHVVRAGGRVVKNVAGFDLVRLSAGAWGTLGVITEVTVRLRALPPAVETLVAGVDEAPESIERTRAGLHALVSSPLAAELVGAPLAAAIGLSERPALLMRIGGNAESMRAQRDALARLGAGAFQPVSDGVWATLRSAEGRDDAVWRLSRQPAAFAATWTAGRRALAAAGGGWMHGSPLRGTVRCGAPAAGPDAMLRALALPFDGVRVGERLPAGVWPALPSPVGDRLSRGVRRAFDPGRLLNPGILGDTA